MSEFPKTPRTSITRLPKRGVYDKETIYAILDEALKEGVEVPDYLK